MKMPCLMMVVLFSQVTFVRAADDPLAARKEKWQSNLDQWNFPLTSFTESNCNVLYSISQYRGVCNVHMVYKPHGAKGGSGWEFRFERDDKVLFALPGHANSQFIASKDVVYFASFANSASGCIVSAHDQKTGKELWKSTLTRISGRSGFTISNQVLMNFSDMKDFDRENAGSITICVHDAIRDYIEVLDAKTGERLAHRTFAKEPERIDGGIEK